MQKEQRTVTKKAHKESQMQKGCLRQKGCSLEMKTGGAGAGAFPSLPLRTLYLAHHTPLARPPPHTHIVLCFSAEATVPLLLTHHQSLFLPAAFPPP